MKRIMFPFSIGPTITKGKDEVKFYAIDGLARKIFKKKINKKYQ